MYIKGIIFDFDGTIVSQEIDFKKIFLEIRQLASQYKLKEPEEMLPILEYLKKIQKLNKTKSREFLKGAHAILLARELEYSKNAKPIKGATEFLSQLKKSGIAIGVVTRNSRSVVEKILKEKNIPFDVLLAREDVPEVKPHPSHIRLMIKKLGLKKTEVLVAGDHMLDVLAAKKLGILSCGVLSGGKTHQDFIDVGADFVYNDITHLAVLLGLEKLPEGKLEHQLLKYLIKKYCVLDTSVQTGPGIGMDAAIIKTSKDILLLKSDPITLVSKNIGEYAVTINANDVACLGGIPRWLLTTIIFPAGTRFPVVEETFADISQECHKHNIAWVGGHTEISASVSQVVLCCAIAGEKLKHIKQIKKIKSGDALIMVKQAGIEGASILAREKPEIEKIFPGAFKKAMHATKNPGLSIVKEAMIAWNTADVIRMHDPTEGGIACGIAEIAESLGCGFILNEKNIDFYKPARMFCDYLKMDVYGLISSGCLLVAVPARIAEKLINRYRKCGIRASVIGYA
ncbi:MAG TPA: HAD-IA family hydrolase, partial [bacterium]|nr:HAD-IA family hydrolase [bacterium]